MRKMISAILSVVLLFSVSVPAWAAENSMDNFKSIQTYERQFSDVPSSNWAASSVQTCYEYGLMNGVSDTQFRPKGSLTVAEALVMACRVHQIYSEGKEYAGERQSVVSAICRLRGISGDCRAF